METTNMIFNIITAIATCFMVFVAWFALKTWRKEFIGKQRMSLAREIMESVYDIQDLLIVARLDGYTDAELRKILSWMQDEYKKDPHHTAVCSDKLNYMTPQYRLNQGADKIDKFMGLINKSQMYWDDDIMILFKNLHAYILKVRYASKNLYYSDNPESHLDLIKIAFNTGADNQVTKEINNIVEEFKLNLEPLYKDQRITWQKIK